jgi:gas vesicle protein
MGKTIALKLTEKEEQIIAELNKQGISNSELLRNALRGYLKETHDLPLQENLIEDTFQPKDNTALTSSDAFKELKHEIHDLREQMNKTQKQVQSDVLKLQRQLYLLTITDSTLKQAPTPIKLDIAYDIHQQIDDFLKKR